MSRLTHDIGIPTSFILAVLFTIHPFTHGVTLRKLYPHTHIYIAHTHMMLVVDKKNVHLAILHVCIGKISVQGPSLHTERPAQINSFPRLAPDQKNYGTRFDPQLLQFLVGVF